MHLPGQGYGLVKTETLTMPDNERTGLLIKTLSKGKREGLPFPFLAENSWYIESNSEFLRIAILYFLAI